MKVNNLTKELKISELKDIAKKLKDYTEINEKFNQIKKIIENNKTNLENEIENLRSKYNNIDIDIYNEIYNSLLKLNKNMDNCYICGEKINNFDEIKNKMKETIDEYKKTLINLPDIKPYIEFFNEINFLSKDTFYADPYEYLTKLELSKNNFIDNINAILYKIYDNNNIQLDKDIENLEINYKEYINLKESSSSELKLIKDHHFDIIKNILETILGENRIKFNFKEVQNFIEIDGEYIKKEDNETPLPLSSGEKSLIDFVFNLFIAIAKCENDNKKIMIIDDPNDFFDDKNLLNMSYLLKMATNDYKLKFIIFTHDDAIINNLSKSKYNMNLQIMYKNENDERIIKNVEENEIKFLSFSEGLESIKNLITKIDDEKTLTIIIIYLMWILRNIEYIFSFNQEKRDAIFNFTKYPHIFCEDENNNNSNLEELFNKALNYIKEYFGCDFQEKINYNSYKKNIRKIGESYDEIKKINIDNFDNLTIIKCNIINIVKLIFLREKMREYFYDKNNLDENESLNNLIDKKYKNKQITENFKINSKYILNICNGYIHIENKPSLLINGISLDKKYVNNLINIWINNLERNNNEW